MGDGGKAGAVRSLSVLPGSGFCLEGLVARKEDVSCHMASREETEHQKVVFSDLVPLNGKG